MCMHVLNTGLLIFLISHLTLVSLLLPSNPIYHQLCHGKCYYILVNVKGPLRRNMLTFTAADRIVKFTEP